MKKLLSLLVVLMTVNILYGQLKIKVSGRVTGNTEGFNKVFCSNRLVQDSAEIINGKFEMTFNETEAGSRAISIEYDKGKRRMYAPLMLFYDESGNIEVDFDIEKGLSSASIKGMPSAVIFHNFSKGRSEVFVAKRKMTLEKYGATALNKSDPNFEEANRYFEEELSKGYSQLLEQNFDGSRIVMASLVLNVLPFLSSEKAEYYYNKMERQAKESDAGKTLFAKIQGMKNAYIGATVKDFTLPNESDELKQFNQFKGKYILLDFWASWCAPCRASFPRVREVYSQLKNKNFDIVNISIDQNKNAWLKAVKEEANPWPQLYDDKKIASELFNVSAIPTCYLIDPEGKIIMKEIGFASKGGGAIERKLEEIFNIKL